MASPPDPEPVAPVATALRLIAQLTDTHVVEAHSDEVTYVDNNARVAEAITAINAEFPAVDAVLATGDLTQWGSAGEYEMLARLFDRLQPMILPLPGNHDDRDRLRLCFPRHPWIDAEHASWTVVVGDVRLVGLDTTIPGQPGAEFDADREAWLSATLSTPHDGPTLLAMHHPPFRTGIAWMDAAGFLGLDRLTAVLAERGGVDRIVCGHLHRPISSMIAGIPAEVGLSTAVHVALDLDPAGPIRVVRDPSGYRLHALAEGTIVSHTRYIGTGEVPFVPAWATDQ